MKIEFNRGSTNSTESSYQTGPSAHRKPEAMRSTSGPGTLGDPGGLVNVLRSADPQIELIGTIAGETIIENKIHSDLAEYRIDREWFRWCDPVQILIEMHLSTNGQMHRIDVLLDAAEQCGVSRSYLAEAKQLSENHPALFAAIQSGEKTITEAKAEIKQAKKAARRRNPRCGKIARTGAG